MSTAPANRASIAAGPALKVFHSTFTRGPSAFSKKPLAFPTIAWEGVTFGYAPTRTVLALPCAKTDELAKHSNIAIPRRLFTLAASDDHGQNAAWFFSPLIPVLSGALRHSRTRLCDQVRQRGVFQYACRRITYIEEDLVQRPVRKIPVNQIAQLLGVGEGSQRPVNQPYDFAQPDLVRRTTQLIATLGTPAPLANPSILQFDHNQLEKFLRQVSLVGDISNSDRTLLMMASEHHHGLKSVQSFF